MSERKIVEYKFVMCDRESQPEFEEQMKVDLLEGWQPYGSPMLEDRVAEDEDLHFWQAMVKYEA